MSVIRIISASSELGAGTRGASLGFAAMRTAAWNKGSEYFATHPPTVLPVFNENILDRPGAPYKERIRYIVQTCEIIAQAVGETIQNGDFPIVVSGDHSNATGTISGLKIAHPDKKLGVVWIDAHADMHSPFSTPSGNVHGMPLGAVTGLDNKPYQINYPESEVVEAWEQLKNIGNIAPKIEFKDMVLIAARDMEKAERFILKQHSIPNYTVQKVRESGVDAIVAKALKHLEDCDCIFVSFDVDSLDSDISKGTGTPVKSGLTVSEAHQLLKAFARQEKVCCFEITEVNPTLDNKKNHMAEIALELLEDVSVVIESRL
jgi:arginase